MSEWEALGSREPWHRLPPRLDHDHLPDLIRRIADVALYTWFGLAERRALLQAAVKHGEHRFGEGVPEEILGREFELLRWALWKRVKAFTDCEDPSQAIIRIDSALTFVHGGSLRGFHRHNIEATADWNDTLERFLSEWQFPGNPA